MQILNNVYILLKLIKLSWQQPNCDIYTNVSASYNKRIVAADGIRTQPLY